MIDNMLKLMLKKRKFKNRLIEHTEKVEELRQNLDFWERQTEVYEDEIIEIEKEIKHLENEQND